MIFRANQGWQGSLRPGYGMPARQPPDKSEQRGSSEKTPGRGYYDAIDLAVDPDVLRKSHEGAFGAAGFRREGGA